MKQPRKKLPAPASSAFHTRERANAGIKLPLYTPEGVLTSHWLLVRGRDSDEYQIAHRKAQRGLADLLGKSEAEALAVTRERELDLFVSLIAGWSFDEPFTDENVRNFLTEAPQIREKVDELASRRDFFFKLQSKLSTDTPKSGSD